MKKSFFILFILLPALLAAVIFLKPDTALSENENRPLTVRKDISRDIKGGQFQSKLESFLSDQMPLREATISLQHRAAYALGRRDIGGAYILKDYRLVQKITPSAVDTDALVSAAKRMNAVGKEVPLYTMYIPSAEISLRHMLPTGAPTYDDTALYDALSAVLGNGNMIDLRPVLRGRADAYYQTDHHWNYTGAALAYDAWCSAHGYTASQYRETVLTEEFRGTLYSKVLLADIPYDTIFAPEVTDDITVTADGQEIPLCDLTALKGKDKYNVFEGGNHGVVTIENHSHKNGKTLLIVKDSFANSLVPFLVHDYGKIVMLDTRYTFISPADFANQVQPDEVAVIREMIN